MVGSGRLRWLARLGILVSLLVLFGAGATTGAQANTACRDLSSGNPALHVQLNGGPVVVNGTMPSSKDVCADGTPAAGSTAVLDFVATLTGDTPQTRGDFFLCLRGFPDTDKPNASVEVRRSHVSGSSVQRVAIATPLRDPEYEISVHSADGVFNQFGCDAPAGSELPFALVITYHTSPAGATSHDFAFATQDLPIANPSQSTPGSGEPSIVVDRLHGDRVYVSAPVGVPSGLGCVVSGSENGCNGVNFWFSLNAGGNFTFCNASDPNGGGDSALALDTTGSIYSADLAATNLDTQKMSSSDPHTAPTPKGGADCGFTNTAPTGAASDRQWLATYLPDPNQGSATAKVLLSYHDLAAQLVYDCVGVGGGAAYISPCSPIITDPAVLVDATGNTINGNQVFDSKGVVYSIFGTSDAASNLRTQGNGPIHNLYVGSSPDGVAFTDHKVVSLPDTRNVANIFPVIAIDHSDNLYVVWSEQPVGGGQSVVKLTSSSDQGKSWTTPVVVSSSDLHSNVLPWIVAGDDGRVDVVWVGSKADKSDDVTADWNVYMAQSVNAHDSNPKFVQTRVTTQPVRYGGLCFKGIGCVTDGDDGRILLDFISADLDSKCMANIAYGNSGPDTSNINNSPTSGFVPFTAYARQTAGGSLCSPVTNGGGANAGGANAAAGSNSGPSSMPFTAAIGMAMPWLPLAIAALGLLLLLGVAALLAGRRRPRT